MNYRQLQYAVLLSETGNFSQVAQRLNITQPALSKQILNLEKELGIQLFDRNNMPVALTPAGEHFIKEAKELLFKEDRLLRSMEQFKSGEKGSLVIGATPFRSSYLLPDVVMKLRVKYPGVQVKICEVGSEILRHKAAEGEFDFSIINLPVDEEIFDIIPIETDSLVLVVPNALAEKYELKDIEKIDFVKCSKLPFVVVGQTQEMRKLFEGLCISADFIPDIAAEVVSITTAWKMACAGVGATLLPMQFVGNAFASEDVRVIKINDFAYLRQPAVITRKGQYISEYTSYAIKLLTNK